MKLLCKSCITFNSWEIRSWVWSAQFCMAITEAVVGVMFVLVGVVVEGLTTGCLAFEVAGLLRFDHEVMWYFGLTA